MRYRLLSRAADDLHQAISYYEEIQSGLGLEFLDDFELAMRNVTEFPEAKLLKVYDVNPIPDAPCAVAETDQEIIDDPDIQAVFICTPNYRIVPLCKAAMLAGGAKRFGVRKLASALGAKELAPRGINASVSHHNSTSNTTKALPASEEIVRLSRKLDTPKARKKACALQGCFASRPLNFRLLSSIRCKMLTHCLPS